MIPVHPKVCWDYKVVDQKLFFLGKILNAIKVKVGIAVRMPIKTWKKLTLYPWILSLQNFLFVYHYAGFPGSSNGKESACSAGDPCLIPGSGRSPREGHGNPLQYSCLENHMDRGAWRATPHGVAKSLTWLSDLHTHSQDIHREHCCFVGEMHFEHSNTIKYLHTPHLDASRCHLDIGCVAQTIYH